MKTTLDLPDEVVREAKLRAVTLGRPLKDLVADFIRQGLGHPVTPPAKASTPSQHLSFEADGMPLIRCSPDAPASRSTVQELLALERQALADDDLIHAGLAL